MKLCRKCGTSDRTKPTKDKPHGRCRLCLQRKWRAEHPPKQPITECKKCGSTERTKPERFRPWGRCARCYEAARQRFMQSPKGKESAKIASKKRYQDKPEAKLRAAALTRAKKLGVSPERQAEMLAEQKGLCAACGGPMGPGKDTHLDHDHATGLVRGFIHAACNHALGMVRDSPERLRKIADYLDRHLANTATVSQSSTESSAA